MPISPILLNGMHNVLIVCKTKNNDVYTKYLYKKYVTLLTFSASAKYCVPLSPILFFLRFSVVIVCFKNNEEFEV